MNNEIEKFRKKMLQAVQDIDTLIYVLEGGIERDEPSTVSEELNLYGVTIRNIKNAFDDLNKTAGNEIIPYSSKIDTRKFIQEYINKYQ